MRPELHPEELVPLLEGAWRIGATNFPLWLSGERRFPTVRFEPIPNHPDRLAHLVSYAANDGAVMHIDSISRLRRGEFRSRNKRLFRFSSSRWSVAGMSDDRAIAVIRFVPSRVTPAGINVLARAGEDIPNLREIVAGASASLGLSPDDFARLTWFDPRETATEHLE